MRAFTGDADNKHTTIEVHLLCNKNKQNKIFIRTMMVCLCDVRVVHSAMHTAAGSMSQLRTAASWEQTAYTCSSGSKLTFVTNKTKTPNDMVGRI